MEMKKYYLFLIMLFITTVIAAQNIENVWTEDFGGIGDDKAFSLVVDKGGNVITTGLYFDSVDFDPGSETYFLAANGECDIFIQKLDKDGNFLWAKSIGGVGWDKGLSVDTDSENNIYITGTFSGYVDFDPGDDSYFLDGGCGGDAFILKLEASGEFVWVKHIAGSVSEANCIYIDDDSYILLTGEFYGTVDFDPGLANYQLTGVISSYDAFAAKYDMEGNFIWAKSFAGSGSQIGTSLSVDKNDNVYIVGNFADTVDFDPGAEIFELISNGQYDVFILKLDASGNFKWANSMGASDYDKINAIAIDNQNNVLITGSFMETVDFDPSESEMNVTAQGYKDIFVQKLDSEGNMIWLKIIGNPGYAYSHSICLDGSDNLYISGAFSVTTDFDPGSETHYRNNNGFEDTFILKLDQQGNFVWVESFGGSHHDEGLCVKVDNLGMVYLAGFFNMYVDFYSNTAISEGLSDMYVQKFDQSSILSGIVDSNDNTGNLINIYPNPTNGVINIEFVENNIGRIVISDIAGKKIVEMSVISQRETIDLSSLEKGVYMITVETENNISTTRILKE